MPPPPLVKFRLPTDGLSGFLDPTFPGGYAVDNTVRWRPVNPRGIDRGNGAMWSGRVNDVLARPLGGALVATDTGGLWLTLGNGPAICVSDQWVKPDVNCLVVGPGPDQVLAFTSEGGCYASNWTGGLPLLAWVPVVLPSSVGTVLAAAYLAPAGILVLASDTGVHWTPWPPAPVGPWFFTQVPGLPAGGFSGVAAGPGDTACAAYWGANPATAFYGIVNLTYTAAGGVQVTNAHAQIAGVNQASMLYTRLTSSPADRRRMYAAAAGGGAKGDELLAVLRSDDGGLNWRPCGTALTPAGNPPETLLQRAGGLGNGWNNTITASPVNPDVLLFGWRHGGVFTSEDGGATWTVRATDRTNASLHADVHALRFDPADPAGRRFLVGSDGGLVVTDDLGATYRHMNTSLATLQFNGPSRGMNGTLSASQTVPGLVAGPLQDNGIVAARPDRDQPWLQINEGDGYYCAFLATGQLVHNFLDVPAPKIRWARATEPPTFSDPAIVPLRHPAPGAQPDRNGLYDPIPNSPSHSYRNPLFAAVRRPSFHRTAPDGDQHTMYAVGSTYNDVYGLFVSEVGANPGWDYLGSVPIDRNTHRISALGSWNGANIYVGTDDGRIFALDAKQGSTLELTVAAPVGEPIKAIVPYDQYEGAFAIRGDDLLRSQGFRFVNVSGLPIEHMFGLEARSVSLGQIDVAVATDSRVYLSHDEGATWRLASTGLPSRPHLTGLSYGLADDGGTALYASSYGRSMWVLGTAPWRMTLAETKLRLDRATAVSEVAQSLQRAGRPNEALLLARAAASTVDELATVPTDGALPVEDLLRVASGWLGSAYAAHPHDIPNQVAAATSAFGVVRVLADRPLPDPTLTTDQLTRTADILDRLVGLLTFGTPDSAPSVGAAELARKVYASLTDRDHRIDIANSWTDLAQRHHETGYWFGYWAGNPDLGASELANQREAAQRAAEITEPMVDSLPDPGVGPEDVLRLAGMLGRLISFLTHGSPDMAPGVKAAEYARRAYQLLDGDHRLDIAQIWTDLAQRHHETGYWFGYWAGNPDLGASELANQREAAQRAAEITEPMVDSLPDPGVGPEDVLRLAGMLGRLISFLTHGSPDMAPGVKAAEYARRAYQLLDGDHRLDIAQIWTDLAQRHSETSTMPGCPDPQAERAHQRAAAAQAAHILFPIAQALPDLQATTAELKLMADMLGRLVTLLKPDAPATDSETTEFQRLSDEAALLLAKVRQLITPAP